MHDPVLTTDGVKSAKEVLEHPKKRFNKPTLVLISPLQRCIQTALYAFHPEGKKAAGFLGSAGEFNVNRRDSNPQILDF